MRALQVTRLDGPSALSVQEVPDLLAFGRHYEGDRGAFWIAMPLIGGMMSWVGPLIGAVLLGTVQQVVQVTISSAWNLLIVGVLLVVFVVWAVASYFAFASGAHDTGGKFARQIGPLPRVENRRQAMLGFTKRLDRKQHHGAE